MAENGNSSVVGRSHPWENIKVQDDNKFYIRSACSASSYDATACTLIIGTENRIILNWKSPVKSVIWHSPHVRTSSRWFLRRPNCEAAGPSEGTELPIPWTVSLAFGPDSDTMYILFCFSDPLGRAGQAPKYSQPHKDFNTLKYLLSFVSCKSHCLSTHKKVILTTEIIKPQKIYGKLCASCEEKHNSDTIVKLCVGSLFFFFVRIVQFSP